MNTGKKYPCTGEEVTKVNTVKDKVGNRVKAGDYIAIDSNPYKPSRASLQICEIDHITDEGRIYTKEYSGVGMPGNQVVKIVTTKSYREKREV